MPESTQEEHGRSDLPQQLEEEPRDSELVGPTEPIRDASSRIAAAMLGEANPSTGEHSEDVVLVAAELCDRLGLRGEERENVLVAARLHDVGKIAIPRDVLDKPGPLTDAEWALVKEHTVTGERILRSISELASAAALVRHSHEHFDGNGYPDRLSGDEIPLGSRIILCADAFHAIRSDRPYRKGRTTKAALRELQSCAGTQFDPDVVAALRRSAFAAPHSVRSRRMSRRLAVLLAMLTLGAGGAYAAERGWIPSPIPGVGPERGTDATQAQSGAAPVAVVGERTETDAAAQGLGQSDRETPRNARSGSAAAPRDDAGAANAQSAPAPVEAVPPAAATSSGAPPVATATAPGSQPGSATGTDEGSSRKDSSLNDGNGSGRGPRPAKGQGQGSPAKGEGSSRPGKGKGKGKGKGAGKGQSSSKPGKGEGAGQGQGGATPGKGAGAGQGQTGQKPGNGEGQSPPGLIERPPGRGALPAR